DERADRLRVFGAEHRRGGVGEQDVQVLLILRADREPAEAVEDGVVPKLEPEGLGVERLCPVLVEHEHVHVVEAADHRCSFGCGSWGTVRAPWCGALLPDCSPSGCGRVHINTT